MSDMQRPVLDFADVLYPGLRDKKVSECTPEESIVAGIAWMADNSEYGIDDAARKLIEEFRRYARSENAPIVPTKEMIEAGRVAIMGMLEPKRAAMPKPSIAELEAILNADSDSRNINIEPDGSITELTPRTTTASEVAKTAYEAMVAAAREAK